MKVNIFLSFFSLCLAALIGFLVYTFAERGCNDVLCGICCGISLFSTLLPLMGLKYDSVRTSINIRVCSACFFFIFLLVHLGFSIWGVVMPYYVIITGIIIVVFLSIIYMLNLIKE